MGLLPPRRNSVSYVGIRTYPVLVRETPDSLAPDGSIGWHVVLAAESYREPNLADILQPTVYVVDDDDAVRDSLKILLESYELAVRDFSSVAEFLEDLEPSAGACLVLDLHLPVIGGFEVMNTLARRGLHLPVIVITGRGDTQTKARALHAGALALLPKPVEEKSLMAAL